MPDTDIPEEYEVQLPFGAPPVLPDVTQQLKEYLLCPERLPIHNYEHTHQYWHRKANPSSLYHYELSPLGTTLKVDRDPTTGELIQFKEVALEDMGCTAKNSMSLQRAPGDINEATRGSTSNYPFWPGGFPEPNLENDLQDQDVNIDFKSGLLTLAPGFEKGIEFKSDGFTQVTSDPVPAPATLAPESRSCEEDFEDDFEDEAPFEGLMTMLQQETDQLGLWSSKKNKTAQENPAVNSNIDQVEIDSDISEMLRKDDNIPVLKIRDAEPVQMQTKTGWAEMLDVSKPVTDFHQKIPDMAITWDFELDTFQKLAIMKLEEHANVFVAAHTSAGKTVVAEYAIALSKKNMTRAIYTSPIKALSNQKYRDFSIKFGDVGLITGDLQINQTSACLIMTTEILRSMLYCGSEVIRDLEYVIFDEVHYINDSERGYVWEEVLILLPEHVSIVMLSATVPNTLEFADWVGCTKRKKVYVISTKKRPVPLQHFLYTGLGGGSKNERFLVLGKDNIFLQNGYSEAEKAKARRESTFKPGTGARNAGPKRGRPFTLNPQARTTMWEGLISHLRKDDKLPVVAFILSRNRCDETAASLIGLDLTTASERHEIKVLFEKWLLRLKEPDRQLPQVLRLKELLKQGIGVHHSGILPILKEIVEMLFDRKKVKLLFATETFAMGINMPTRTVVFDSIMKFDSCMRNLRPAEYIQMAGRAGRRGLDDIGTVILICSGILPKEHDLKEMMLGKATSLSSKFQLKYSTILNLLRVPQISVEDMMGRSFMEFNHQNNQSKYRLQLKDVEQEIENLSQVSQPLPDAELLTNFYNIISEYLNVWNWVWPRIARLSKSSKDLCPGRVVVITHKSYTQRLGLVLNVEQRLFEPVYKVLVLQDGVAPDSGDISIPLRGDPRPKVKEDLEEDLRNKMLQFLRQGIYLPTGNVGHTILTIALLDIFSVSKYTIKVNTGFVLSDWLKRQSPRFRDDPVGPECSRAIKELTELTLNISPERPLECIDFTSEIRVMEPELMMNIKGLFTLAAKFTVLKCHKVSNLETQFKEVFKRSQLLREQIRLKQMQSIESLSLYPDYASKLNVLRELQYIDSNNSVQLKGKVACEMGNHELIITELVLYNTLLNFPPAEIAALLSCLVFKQRTAIAPELSENIKKGKELILEKVKNIMEVEKRNKPRLSEADPSNSNEDCLKFGLTEVVYDWAIGKPFQEIMKLTDVQEGIIVRCIQQLNETLQDVKNAAHFIGDPTLKDKMEKASDAIKRDIVFAASLYTVNN